MLRERLFLGPAIVALVVGMSLCIVGCEDSGIGDPVTILVDFQKDTSAASKKYQGKSVRLRVEKVITASKTTVKGSEFVTVQGQVGNIIIDATVADPAEQENALALKIGEPALFEGEPAAGMGEVRGAGALFLKSAKVTSN